MPAAAASTFRCTCAAYTHRCGPASFHAAVHRKVTIMSDKWNRGQDKVHIRELLLKFYWRKHGTGVMSGGASSYCHLSSI